MPARPTEARQARASRAAVARLAGELYETRVSQLRAIARAHVGRGPEEAIEDTIQNALLSFIQAFPGDPADRDGAWRYLQAAVRTAAWRTRRTHARKDAPLVSLEGFSEPSRRLAGRAERHLRSRAREPEEAAIEREDYDEASWLLGKLPAEERACLVLRALGLTPREIAAALVLSERQVRKRIETGNRRLRELERGAP